ncbi:olfactory receptor 6N1-like [Acanthochromis polyacanthus]|uniref:olfactory receptor 6N1-like n=1 Tax=Acanthochromis polyacanthus TaxID=80966 RepID=UPI002234A319|nr:olfactory receptor 6N1-like [Acanthochromis polyacanthus]
MVNQVNQSQVLLLTGFRELGQLRYVFFSLTCAGYLLILVLNISVLVLICAKPRLHQPMYILLANLLLNTLIGCAAFYPKLLLDLLSGRQQVSRRGCLLQAFWVHLYVSVECNVLTVMALDRYAAVSRPLTYHSLLRPSTVLQLLLGAWLLPAAAYTCLIGLSSRLPLCGFQVSRTFCDNRSITHLSCVDVSLIGGVELLLAAAVVFLPLLLIFGCYVQILAVSFRLSSSGRPNKALATCVPHLVTYVSLVSSIVFEVVQPALANRNLPHALRVVMSMEGFLLPPLLNPLIYGVNLPEIRHEFTHLFTRMFTTTRRK